MAQNTTSPFNSKLIVRDILNLNTKYYIPEGGRGRGLLTGRISEPEMSFRGVDWGLSSGQRCYRKFTVSFQMAQTNTTTAIRLRLVS